MAILCDILTDNRNRTASEVRTIFDRNGGSMGTSGSVAFQFSRQGVIAVSGEAVDEETLMEAAIEAGAEDVQAEEGTFIVFTPMSQFTAVKDALASAKIGTESAEISNVPQNTVEGRRGDGPACDAAD